MRFEREIIVSIGVIVVMNVSPVRAQSVPDGFEFNTEVSGLSQPTTMAFIGPDEFFVLEKATGRVKHVDTSGGPDVTIVLDLDVNSSSERGLLGIALRPNFPMSGHVYLYYTNANPLEHRIERYTWDPDNMQLNFNASIITLPATPGPNHDGGIILFGPDRKLYGVIGDLNRNEMTQNFDNGTVSDTSVVLRLNQNGSTPADNPFDTSGWEQFYGYGVRNSFGLAFDPLTGDLWDTENGPATFDEVNHHIAGFNSGWEKIMGPDERDPQNVDDLVLIDGATYSDPAFSWLSTVAPTAIRFMDSCRWDHTLRFDCFVGDNNFGRLYKFQPNQQRNRFILTGNLSDRVFDPGDDLDQILWGSGFGIVTDIQIGPDGYMYVVSLSTGTVKRVRPEFPEGDLNRNGFVGLVDRNRFVNLALGLSDDPDEIEQGDFDGNGVIDGEDIQCMVTSLFMPN